MATALADARRGHRGLFAFAIAMSALTPVLAVLAVVDDRVLLGAPLWLKPLKFAISLALYSATLAWMLGQLRERTLQRAGWVVTVAAAVEMAIIIGQAAVGNRSHYNMDTPLSAALWGTMGATIAVLWLATLAVALRFLSGGTRQGLVAGPDGLAQSPGLVPPTEPGRDRAAGTAIRLGLVVALIGLAEGFLMASAGAHAVGAPDGGPGLPFVGWSTTGGDLRIAHFVGMHALQGLPLLAFALVATRLGDATRVRLVRIAAAAWAGLVVLLTWQALRAQPLLAPDATTLAALATLLALTGAATVGTLATARRSTVPTTV